MNPPRVAVPTLITAAVRTPAKIVGVANGSSIRQRTARGGSPSASADSRRDAGIPVRPACVFRMIGSRLYRNNAAIAGGAPVPFPTSHIMIGIMNSKSANEGIVCRMPVAAKTSRQNAGWRAAITPSGTPTSIAASSDGMTNSKCSPVVASTR